MMKLIYRTIAVSVLATLLAAVRADSLPIEPDYPCYMRDTSGRIIDLTQRLCRVSVKATQLATGDTPLSTREPSTPTVTEAMPPLDDDEKDDDSSRSN